MAKNSKFIYYLRTYSLLLCPKFILRHIMRRRLKEIAASPEREYIMGRVDYYNKLGDGATLPDDAPTLGSHTLKNKKCGSVYFFDTYEFTRHFPDHLRWLLKGGRRNYNTRCTNHCKKPSHRRQQRKLGADEAEQGAPLLFCERHHSL